MASAKNQAIRHGKNYQILRVHGWVLFVVGVVIQIRREKKIIQAMIPVLFLLETECGERTRGRAGKNY